METKTKKIIIAAIILITILAITVAALRIFKKANAPIGTQPQPQEQSVKTDAVNQEAAQQLEQLKEMQNNNDSQYSEEDAKKQLEELKSQNDSQEPSSEQDAKNQLDQLKNQ
jgi:uncharacterized protein YpmB